MILANEIARYKPSPFTYADMSIRWRFASTKKVPYTLNPARRQMTRRQTPNPKYETLNPKP